MPNWWLANLDDDAQYAAESRGDAKCEDCKFYLWVDSGYGYCRRYPPKDVNVGKWWNPKWKISYQLVEWCRRACGEFIRRQSK